MVPRVVLATLALGAAAMDATEQLAWLMKTVEAQSARLDAQEKEIARLSARLAGDAGAGAGKPAPTPAQEGRRLSADERSTWQESLYHIFEEPASAGCDLHEELSHDSTGPLLIKRTQNGKLSMAYGSTEAFNIDSPLSVRHPTGCTGTTLELKGDVSVPSGSLSLNGVGLKPPALENTLVYNHYDDTGGALTSTGEVCCTDIPGMAKTVVLTETSKVIVSYVLRGSITAGGAWRYIFTDLKLSTDGGAWTNLDAGKAVHGVAAGNDGVTMGSNTGIWMGELPAGSHEFMVIYNSNGDLNIYQPWTMQIMVL